MKLDPSDRELMRALGPERPTKMLANFALALLFGAASALPALEMRELAQRITARIISARTLKAAQPTGLANMSAIIILCALLLLWLAAFMYMWRRIERSGTPVRTALVPTACALAAYGLLRVLSFLI